MKAAFDEVIHAPHRLRVCAFLDVASSAEFSTVRDMLGVADSVLSKHVKVLQEAGYLKITKPLGQGRVRTWLALTTKGRKAYSAHVAALHELVGGQSPV